jgi:peptidoglycan/xylan/chitin deacetylase (PgdA/CDA1 family)
VTENRGRFALLAAVLVVAGIAVLLAGNNSSNDSLGSSGSDVTVPRSLAADDAANPHARVVVAPKKVPPRVPSGAYELLPAPAATPVALPGEGGPLAPVVSRLPITDKVIFLGIDDGLVRDPQVLDLLKRAKVPFTMFLVQGAADTGEAFWQQAQKDGGTVESHTITHPDLTKVSEQRRHDEICGTLDDFQERFGHRPTLFRPPYGAYNDAVRADAAECGFKALIMWKGSTNDGRFDLQDGTNLQPGDIILMHWRTDLYQNLLKVFDTVRTQGFSIGKLEDYFPSPPTTTTAPAKSAKKKP